MTCRRKSASIFITILIIILLLIMDALMEFGYVPTTKSGFYCQDPIYSFPFRGDTFPMKFLALVALIVPLVVMSIIEAILYQPGDYVSHKIRFIESGKNTFRWYCSYFIGGVLNVAVIEISKCSMGEHRPHFFDSCSPDSAINCTKGEYITEYNCLNAEVGHVPYFILDASKSFPSGHASVAVHVGLFLFWYFQQRMKYVTKVDTRFITMLLQIMALGFAIFISLSRITDNRHHWWDVVVGVVLGVTTAIYSITALAKNFKMSSSSLSRDSISNSDISGDRSTTHPSVRRLLSVPPTYNKEVSIE